MFKKIWWSFVILGSLILAVPVSALENRGAFVITDFKVDILVKKDATLEVEEIIAVNFSEKRHGIFRNIPVKYENDNGFKYNMNLKVLSVQNEKGRAVPYKISSSGNDKVLKIGDPDLEIIGDQKYFIEYEIERGVRYFEDHDEIYWNPVGTGWPTTINKASTVVAFEPGMKYLENSGVCFTGEFGSKEKNCLVNEKEKEVFFVATKKLNSHQGLTVAVHLPKGEIYEPTRKEYILMFLADNWGFGLPVGVFVLMYVVWWRKGKEIDLNKTTIAHYEAPNNLTPGEVGYLLKEKYSAKFVTADIINLAVKGYLDIHETEKTRSSMVKIFRLILIIPFGLILFSVLVVFLSSRDVDMIGILFFIPIPIVFIWKVVKFSKKKKDEFEYELKNKKDWSETQDLTGHEKELLKGLFGSKKLGKIKLADKKNSFYKNVQLAGEKIKDKLNTKGFFETKLVNKGGFYFVTGMAVFFGVILLGGFGDRLDLVFGSILSLPIVILFGVFMSKKTQKGAEVYWEIQGYKHYIDVAEKYRAEFNAKENIFEKNLPYAMIFGNIDKWAKAFEGIAKEQPNWYHSSSANSFSPVFFASTINSGLTSATQAASVSPGSSSSGGSSGGGGGGGGGGSW